jgi:hypothetical protein
MDISGIKRYLRRTKSVSELEDLADACYSEATETVTITSISSEGTSSSGQVNFPKAQLLQAIEEVLEEGAGGRQMASVIVRDSFGSPV